MQAMIAPGGEPHVRAEGANASLRLTFTRHGSPVLAIEVNVTTHRGPVTTAVLSRIESPVMLVASPRPSEWADILRQSVVELSAAARKNSDIIAEPAAWGLIVGGLDDEDVGDPNSGPLTGDGTLPPLVTHVSRAAAAALARDIADALPLGERLAAANRRAAAIPAPFCAYAAHNPHKVAARFDALINRVAAHRAAQTPPDEPTEPAPYDALDALAARCVELGQLDLVSQLYTLLEIWREEYRTREPLRRLAEAIGRAQGHTTAAIEGAKLEAATGRPVTLICGVGIYTAQDLSHAPGVRARGIDSIERGEVIEGPVVIDPDAIQELARRICPGVRLAPRPGYSTPQQGATGTDIPEVALSQDP